MNKLRNIAALVILVSLASPVAGQYKIPHMSGPSAKQQISKLKTGAMINWGKARFTVDQVVDENNARISVQAMGDFDWLVLHGKPLEIWYEGPTKGLTDSDVLSSLSETRLVGTKTYSAVLGSNTIVHVKRYSELETVKLIEAWKKAYPDAVKLTNKDGESAFANILKYNNSKVTVETIDGVTEVKLSKLDKVSKAAVSQWRKIQREKK